VASFIELSVTTIVHASLHLRINVRFDVIGTVIFISVASASHKDTPVMALTSLLSIRLLDESPEKEEAERSHHHCCNKEMIYQDMEMKQYKVNIMSCFKTNRT
jgi:hypothetical protein